MAAGSCHTPNGWCLPRIVMWVPYVMSGNWPVVVILPFLLLAYAIIAVAVHGRFALDRPEEAHLTGFYVLVSTGGVIATGFVALVAPLVFNAVYEYPVLLVGGLAVLAVLPGPGQPAVRPGPTSMIVDAGKRVAPYVAIGLVLLVIALLEEPGSALLAAGVLVAGGLVIAVGVSPRVLPLGTGIAIVAFLVVGWTDPLVRVRAFFGVIEVRETFGGVARAEYSGATLHGVQFPDARQSEPTTYYVRSGPLGDAFADLWGRLPDESDTRPTSSGSPRATGRSRLRGRSSPTTSRTSSGCCGFPRPFGGGLRLVSSHTPAGTVQTPAGPASGVSARVRAASWAAEPGRIVANAARADVRDANEGIDGRLRRERCSG